MAMYEDDADREVFLALLSQVVRRYRWKCHAYCLMSSHYHLLIETLLANLASGMRDLNGVYARAFNDRRERVGHLCGARYRSVLVESDRQFAWTAFYIAENPVKAGLCHAAEDWRWSSYPAVIGHVAPPGFLTLDDVREHLGPVLSGPRPLPRSAPSDDDWRLTSWDEVPGTGDHHVRRTQPLPNTLGEETAVGLASRGAVPGTRSRGARREEHPGQSERLR